MDKEFKRFCNICHIICNYMHSNSGDLLIDLPKAWDEYNNRDEGASWPVFFVGKSHCDHISRYERILEEIGEPVTYENCVKYAKSSLGMDFIVEITSELVIVTPITLDKWGIRSLEEQFKDYSEVIIGDKPEFLAQNA